MAASPSSNPFVLPGLGQTGDMASNPLFASLEMMRQTFASLSGTNGLTSGLSQMQPTLDPVELEKKINELKSVESWLKLNLSMLSSTIQGMEVQLATIATLRQFVASNNLAAQAEPTSTPDAAQAWWTMLTQQFGQIAAATTASMNAAQATTTPTNSKDSAKSRQSGQKSSSRQANGSKVSGQAEVKKTGARSTATPKK